MLKSYTVYLLVVGASIALALAFFFGVTLADVGSAFSLLGAVLYELRWEALGTLALALLGFLSLLLFHLIHAGPGMYILSLLFTILSICVLAINFPYFISSSESLPANWQENLALLGAAWAFLALAALGRYLFFKSSSSEQEKEDYQPGELLDWGGYYPPTDGSDDR